MSAQIINRLLSPIGIMISRIPPKRKRLQEIALNGKENPYIVEVGAMIGQTVDLVRNLPNIRNPNFLLFEPNSFSYRLLEKKYGNDLDIAMKRCCVSNFIGETEFYENKYLGGSSMLEIKQHVIDEYDYMALTNRVKVPVITLDEYFIESNEDRNIDLLIIDVEGAEFNVLDGGQETLKRVEYIQIEVSLQQIYMQEATLHKVLSLLNNAGFEIIANRHIQGSWQTGDSWLFDLLLKKKSK